MSQPIIPGVLDRRGRSPLILALVLAILGAGVAACRPPVAPRPPYHEPAVRDAPPPGGAVAAPS